MPQMAENSLPSTPQRSTPQPIDISELEPDSHKQEELLHVALPLEPGECTDARPEIAIRLKPEIGTSDSPTAEKLIQIAIELETDVSPEIDIRQEPEILTSDNPDLVLTLGNDDHTVINIGSLNNQEQPANFLTKNIQLKIPHNWQEQPYHWVSSQMIYKEILSWAQANHGRVAIARPRFLHGNYPPVIEKLDPVELAEFLTNPNQEGQLVYLKQRFLIGEPPVSVALSSMRQPNGTILAQEREESKIFEVAELLGKMYINSQFPFLEPLLNGLDLLTILID